MSADRPDALLKSALEKIVYFEARSTQLSNDLANARSEAERLKAELASAAQREIELRREVASLQVLRSRGHQELQEQGRVTDALQRERTQLLGKLIEASRIHTEGDTDDEGPFDLAGFISQLRHEALGRAGLENPVLPPPPEAPLTQVAAAPKNHAERLQAEGRLGVRLSDVDALAAAGSFPGRSEETLFGFSVRELSAPDAFARQRAAERLKVLGQKAAAPALATALHAETDPEVLCALLPAFASLAGVEGAQVAARHLTASHPGVRMAALRTVIALDPAQTAPQLTAALGDPDRSVRRRAALLALDLSGEAALSLGARAIHDEDAQVRALAARALGAAQGEASRKLLLEALADPEAKVRFAAAESLERILSEKVRWVAELPDAPRRREIRRLQGVASNPVLAQVERPKPAATVAAKLTQKLAELPVAIAAGAAKPVLPAEPSEALCERVLGELRISIRGRPLDDLSTLTHAPAAEVEVACAKMAARGQVVKRGAKFFAA